MGQSETSPFRPWVVVDDDGYISDWCETEDAASVMRRRREREDPSHAYHVVNSRPDLREQP